MKSRNLLFDLYNKKITLDESYIIYESILDSPQHADIDNLLHLSPVEATAHAHGASFDKLARWRYEGWPNVCPKCKKKIEIEKFGWWYKGKGVEGIYHISCLDK